MPMTLEELKTSMAIKKLRQAASGYAGILPGAIEGTARAITSPLYEDGKMPQLPGVETRLMGQQKSMQEDTEKEAILTRMFGPREKWSPEVAEKVRTYFNPPEKYKDPNYIRNTAIESALIAAGGFGGLSLAKPMIKDAVTSPIAYEIAYEPVKNMISLFGKKGLGTKVKPATDKVMELKDILKFQTGSKGGRGIRNPETIAQRIAEEAKKAKEKADNFWKMGKLK